MVAAGAYLWKLRDLRGFTRDEVAHITGTNAVQVMRIEKGEIDTRGSLLMSLVKAVKGSADQVMLLLLNERATVEEGRRLAEAWYDHKTGEIDYQMIVDEIPDTKKREALAILDEIIQREGADLPIRVLKALRG